MLSDLLIEGVASGEFEIQDHSIAALALGGMISWAYTWYRPDGRVSARRLGKIASDLAVNGLRGSGG